MNNDIKDIKTEVHAVRQSHDHQQHKEIAGWISSLDYPAQQSDIIARREEDTGQWFLDSSEFITWLSGRKSTLFCPGIPGAGKTMLAAITIDYIWQSKASDDIRLAYIYCNYKSGVGTDSVSLLSALLKQLVQSSSAIDIPIKNLYEQHIRRGTRPSFQEISTALQEVSKSFSTVYIIIDALDECPKADGTRSQLLTKLKDLQKVVDLRLMVTARPIPDIEVEFRLFPILEIRASDTDVKRFVRGQIARLPSCIQRDNQLQGTLEDKIVEAVDGMYVSLSLLI
jgi:hypothetical protein